MHACRHWRIGFISDEYVRRSVLLEATCRAAAWYSDMSDVNEDKRDVGRGRSGSAAVVTTRSSTTSPLSGSVITDLLPHYRNGRAPAKRYSSRSSQTAIQIPALQSRHDSLRTILMMQFHASLGWTIMHAVICLLMKYDRSEHRTNDVALLPNFQSIRDRVDE